MGRLCKIVCPINAVQVIDMVAKVCEKRKRGRPLGSKDAKPHIRRTKAQLEQAGVQFEPRLLKYASTTNESL